MEFDFLFILNSILFGIGLAMDAFSVSLANGLNDPHMKKSKRSLIAGTFAGFQIAMPLLGWLCVHTIATIFTSFQKFIPWIAFLLLGYIGGKMLYEGIKGSDDDEDNSKLTIPALMIQGIATSIDALSVGFTIANYTFSFAFIEAIIIGVVTYFICIGGLQIGKKFGTKLASKASVMGGCILIFIGLEILIKSFL